MKTITIILAVLTSFALHAKADNPIDKQLNAAQDFVVIGTPTYQGFRFLAQSAYENYSLDDTMISKRAIKVCHLMGLGSPVAYSASFVAKTKKAADGLKSPLWNTDETNMTLFSYGNGYWRGSRLAGKSSYISALTCKRK